MLSKLLIPVVESVQAVALPVAILALVVSSLIVVAGLSRRRDLQARQGQRPAINRFELGQTPFAAGLLDVATEACAVLHQFESLAARQLVALEFAIQPQLVVRADRRAFQEILGDLVSSAIEETPCGHVLLGAARRGGRIHITVSDDGGKPDREKRVSKLRPAERLAALQGATMEVDARSGQGTTVSLRMPASDPGRRPPAANEAADPVSIWSPAKTHETNGATS
jgi:hypothetical protein